MRIVEVEQAAGPSSVGLAVSVFNQPITDRLLEGALRRLREEGVGEAVVLRVPGALELPVAAAALLGAGCAAVVALGAVVRGETDHYEIVTRESARGLVEVAVRTGRPVTNGVLAVHEYEHALERSEPGPGNKGDEAALAAVTLARRLGALAAEARSGA